MSHCSVYVTGQPVVKRLKIHIADQSKITVYNSKPPAEILPNMF